MLAEMLLSLKHPNYHSHEGSYRNGIMSYIQNHEPSRIALIAARSVNSQKKLLSGKVDVRHNTYSATGFVRTPLRVATIVVGDIRAYPGKG